MPKLFYIKYFNLIEEVSGKTVFFYSRKVAEELSAEILKAIEDSGGKEHSDIFYNGGIGELRYRCQNNLLTELNKLNEIFNT